MKITISTQVKAPIEKVWAAWTSPEAITQWNFASEDWCCPTAEIDLEEDGTFNYRMEAQDGSMGFNFSGKFILILSQARIDFVLEDDRKVSVRFAQIEGAVEVSEIFTAENEHSAEMQKKGWQAILDNFKSYVETSEPAAL